MLTRSHACHPPRLRRQSAIVEVRLTNRGKRVARKMLMSFDHPLYYSFSYCAEEGMRYYLTDGEQTWCFHDVSALPEFAAN